jgi:hypothetical protein
MSHLPECLHGNVQMLGLEELLQGSPFQLNDVRVWLAHHDQNPWNSLQQRHRIRGPTAELAALDQLIKTFVREYRPGDTPARRTTPGVLVCGEEEEGEDEEEEVLASETWKPIAPRPALRSAPLSREFPLPKASRV